MARNHRRTIFKKKKILMTQINQDGVCITMNKAMEVMEFQLSYFKS